MRQQDINLQRPVGLIAYKRTENTLICWNAVENAAGYNVYSRENESFCADYSSLAYTKINQGLVKESWMYDKHRNATYRVTAVDAQGRETLMSDMVFPVSHRGLEILSIRYFSEGEVLTGLPCGSVTIAVTAINCGGASIKASLRAEWDGRRKSFPLTFPPDGMLHTYTASLGEVKDGPIAAGVYNQEEVPISCISRFRPKGLQLYDTLFENGLLVCEPYTATLYEQEEGEIQQSAAASAEATAPAGLIAPLGSIAPVGSIAPLGAREIENCHIRFTLHRKNNREAVSNEINSDEAFRMYLDTLAFQVSAGWKLEVTDSTGCVWKADVGHTYPAGAARAAEKIQDDECTEADSMTFHIYLGDDNFRVFINDTHMAALTVSTEEAHGILSFAWGRYEMTGLKIVSQKPSFAGAYKFHENSGAPVWNIACWHSRFNWIQNGKADEIQRLADGSILIENPGRSFLLSPGGREVTLEAKGSMEYEHTRRSDEGWTHLLLEVLWERQPCGRLRVAALQNLWLTMDTKILCCENKTEGYCADIHAGQYVVYFNVGGRNNEAMWLGLCNFDNRFLADENRQELICQMDNGTNTFIIAPPQRELVAGTMADGQWHSMSIDLKPVIKRAYEKGRTIGAFATSNFTDLKLNSMNLGFEIPGSMDMAVKLSNLQLVAAQ